MIKYEDIITLSDENEYVVVSKINHEEKDYVFLVDIKNNENVKFAEVLIKDSKMCISEINKDEEDLLDKIIPLFADQAANQINQPI